LTGGLRRAVRLNIAPLSSRPVARVRSDAFAHDGHRHAAVLDHHRRRRPVHSTPAAGLTAALALLLASLAGCASASIPDRVPLAPTSGLGATIVVASNDTQVAFLPLDEAIDGVLSGHGVESVTLANAGGARTAQPPVLVTFQVKNYDVSGDYTPGGAVALYVTGAIFLIPLAFLGLVDMDTLHEIDFEVLVRDLRAAPRVAVASATEDAALLRYDTRGLVPVFRRRYRTQMESSRGWVKKQMGLDSELPEHRQEVASQLATRMLNLALPDVRRAIQELLARPPQAPIAQPAGPGLAGPPPVPASAPTPGWAPAPPAPAEPPGTPSGSPPGP
jgi:hypothetical protein